MRNPALAAGAFPEIPAREGRTRWGVRATTVLLLAVSTPALLPGSAVAEGPSGVEAGAEAESIADSVIERQLTEGRIPGAAVAVVVGGKTVLSKGYGQAEAGGHRPVDAEHTGFFPDSVAKLFTATALSQLIARGEVDPSADVNSYLDDMTVPDTFPGRPVTAADLLTHTGGFDNDVLGLSNAVGDNVPTLADSVADAQPNRVRPPGQVVAYDNYGFALAGHLVEEVTGRPFETYVRSEVLDPLHMDDTSLSQPLPPAVEKTVATGYRPDGDGYTVARGQYGPWSPTGAGVVTTAPDMGRFMASQLGADPALGDGVTGLMQQQHFAQDVRVPGMTYGFTERSWNGHRVLVKDGDLPGFHSNLALVPDAGVGVFVTYNGDGLGGNAFWDAKELVRAVVDGMVPADGTPASGAPGVDAPGETVPNGEIDSYAGTYRPSTVSRDSMMAIAGLTSAVDVQSVGGGRLTTTGLSMDPDVSEQHWVQQASGVFTEVDGHGRIAFDGGVLAGAGPEATAYEKLPWYDSPSIHMVVVAVAAAVMAVGVIGYPVLAVVERRQGADRFGNGGERGSRAWGARLLGWLAGALAVAFSCQFALLVSDGNAMSERVLLGSPLLTALPWVGAATTLAVAGAVLSAPVAWIRSWWTLAGRIGYTVLALAGVSFVLVAAHYGMVAYVGKIMV
ncbi:MAG: beta-lactamase family protein [Tomitella sp.]|nr:beta-lactamase family protein [Tomitella sp.]